MLPDLWLRKKRSSWTVFFAPVLGTFFRFVFGSSQRSLSVHILTSFLHTVALESSLNERQTVSTWNRSESVSCCTRGQWHGSRKKSSKHPEDRNSFTVLWGLWALPLLSESNDLADITLIVNWVCSRDTGGIILSLQYNAFDWWWCCASKRLYPLL